MGVCVTQMCSLLSHRSADTHSVSDTNNIHSLSLCLACNVTGDGLCRCIFRMLQVSLQHCHPDCAHAMAVVLMQMVRVSLAVQICADVSEIPFESFQKFH